MTTALTPRPYGMQIFIKTLTGKTIAIDVETDKTMKSVQTSVLSYFKTGNLAEFRDHAPEHFKIILAGRVINCNEQLSMLNLQSVGTLHLIVDYPITEQIIQMLSYSITTPWATANSMIDRIVRGRWNFTNDLPFEELVNIYRSLSYATTHLPNHLTGGQARCIQRMLEEISGQAQPFFRNIAVRNLLPKGFITEIRNIIFQYEAENRNPATCVALELLEPATPNQRRLTEILKMIETIKMGQWRFNNDPSFEKLVDLDRVQPETGIAYSPIHRRLQNAVCEAGPLLRNIAIRNILPERFVAAIRRLIFEYANDCTAITALDLLEPHRNQARLLPPPVVSAAAPSL